ncbi:hypothetical protein FOA52_000699 [Chlamydomonas sp. UWO 241]|nr:hypothetical protein FOA52_000699 [Chlamydomonas sp. UWO 241]
MALSTSTSSLSVCRATTRSVCTRTPVQARAAVVVKASDSSRPADASPSLLQRVGSLAAAAALAVTISGSQPAFATDLPETVYFGNGCFWGRQKEFVDTEKLMGRLPAQISSVVGYAGGPKAGPDGKVCYYYSDPRTVYEKLGHAEVVKVDIAGSDKGDVTKEFRMFADTFFTQFQRTPGGMMRLDPQDAGPGYRNLVGLPGGVKSPLYQVLQDANVNGMELRAGTGNQFDSWGPLARPTEDDLMNVVWVYDSNALPFYQAEQYHQFHNGIGKAFSKDYRVDLKETLVAGGKITSTGCPELPF